MNDPNGLLPRRGLAPLLPAQPAGIGLGNMSWGHATSTDLTTWTDHPVVIEATDDELVFSGSVVVDRDNTSGLGGDGEPLVAVYTSVYGEGSGLPANTQAQSLAYFHRRRRHLGAPRGQPRAAPRRARGPQLPRPQGVRYEPGGYWVMAAVVADARVVKLFRSGDLLDWQPRRRSPRVDEGLVEMPDLFPLPLDGDDERWVLVVNLNGGAKDGGSGARYLVGEFDGTTFRPDEPGPGAWVDEGADFYAAGTWNEAPGERVAIGSDVELGVRREVPTEPWRGR